MRLRVGLPYIEADNNFIREHWGEVSTGSSPNWRPDAPPLGDGKVTKVDRPPNVALPIS